MSRRSRRFDTWAERQYRDHARWQTDTNGRHERWWELGQQRLSWEEYKAREGITDEEEGRMREEMPFILNVATEERERWWL